MQLCFDATRFGLGLLESIDLASTRQLPCLEYTFEPFPVEDQLARTISEQEELFLQQVKTRCRQRAVELASIKLNYPLRATDPSCVRQFQGMVEKLSLVAKAAGCKKILFYLDAQTDEHDQWRQLVEAALLPCLQQAAHSDTRLTLSLSTPPCHRGRSLRTWRSTEPGEWREFLASMPELSLSFSAADCAWQGIDYLRILSGLVRAIEHVEARDIEVNRLLLSDSGLFGPLWWRYKMPGRGQIDWQQLIEALKLYDFKGTFSIHLDDEFTGDDVEELTDALDSSIKLLAPLVN